MQNFLRFFASSGATLSIGFLSAVGMLTLAPHLYLLQQIFLMTGSFFLATAYEKTVNDEGIGEGLKRVFGRDYLALGVVENYLNELADKKKDFQENIFLSDYIKLKRYIVGLEKSISHLNKCKDSLLRIYQEQERNALAINIAEREKKLRIARNDLYLMKRFFLKELNKKAPGNEHRNRLQTNVAELLGENAPILKKEITKKKWGIRAFSVFTLLAGCCSGWATFGAIKLGLATVFGLSALTPVGLIIVATVAVAAAAGYGLLMYQPFSDKIQNYRLNNWSNAKSNNKLSAADVIKNILVVGVAAGATLANAGTWASLIKDSGIVDVTKKTTNILLFAAVGFLQIPNMLYNWENTLGTLQKYAKKFMKNLFQGCKNTCFKIYSTAKQENIVQFINPFRLVANTLLLAKKFLFLAHCASIGAGSDRVDSIPAMPSSALAAVGSVNEVLTDPNYLHGKPSFLLKLLYLAFDVPVGVLNVGAVAWDWLSTCGRNPLSHSIKKIFNISEEQPKFNDPKGPALSADWGGQRVIETCDNTNERFQRENPLEKLIYNKKLTQEKIHANNVTKAQISSSAQLPLLSSEDIRKLSLPRNTFSFFNGRPTSANEMTDLIETDHVFIDRSGNSQRLGV